jgi:Flp pilus assembly pilin Flp
MVEYALLAGFIAVAAGAAFPPISGQISTIFSKMVSLTDKAGTEPASSGAVHPNEGLKLSQRTTARADD